MLVMANSIYTELAPLRILGLFILLWLPSSSALPIEARQALDDGAGALGEDAKMSSELQTALGVVGALTGVVPMIWIAYRYTRMRKRDAKKHKKKKHKKLSQGNRANHLEKESSKAMPPAEQATAKSSLKKCLPRPEPAVLKDKGLKSKGADSYPVELRQTEPHTSRSKKHSADSAGSDQSKKPKKQHVQSRNGIPCSSESNLEIQEKSAGTRHSNSNCDQARDTPRKDESAKGISRDRPEKSTRDTGESIDTIPIELSSHHAQDDTKHTHAHHRRDTTPCLPHSSTANSDAFGVPHHSATEEEVTNDNVADTFKTKAEHNHKAKAKHDHHKHAEHSKPGADHHHLHNV